MRTPIIKTPFGKRNIIYADYTASGKPYKRIEDFINNKILPYYANIHSNAYCGRLMSKYIAKSKEQIKNSTNCNASDKIIFTGSGSSCAITHFIHILDFKETEKNIVIISEFEHNSNFLPWKHKPVNLEIIKTKENGLLNLEVLEETLIKYKDYDKKIISISGGSNITGIKQEINIISKLGHKYNFYVCFDFAAIAPYVQINMHTDDKNLDYIDALYISPHKFLGGMETPGLLIANKCTFKNECPYFPSGGTVRFASSTQNIYVEDLETKESGGTPNIIGCIKTGLVFQLKDELQKYILLREKEIVCNIKQKLKNIKNLEILNPDCDINVEQIPIYSFVIKDLHYNFVVCLLNDLFGIQSRGGVSCSGIYAEKLLNISKKYQTHIIDDLKHHKTTPTSYGWTRISFHYTMENEIINYIIHCIEFVANYGHLFVNLYSFDDMHNLWHFTNNDNNNNDLENINYNYHDNSPIQKKQLTPFTLYTYLSLANQFKDVLLQKK